MHISPSAQCEFAAGSNGARKKSGNPIRKTIRSDAASAMGKVRAARSRPRKSSAVRIAFRLPKGKASARSTAVHAKWRTRRRTLPIGYIGNRRQQLRQQIRRLDGTPGELRDARLF